MPIKVTTIPPATSPKPVPNFSPLINLIRQLEDNLVVVKSQANRLNEAITNGMGKLTAEEIQTALGADLGTAKTLIAAALATPDPQ